MTKKTLIIHDAQVFEEAEKVYFVNVSVDGKEYSLLIAKHTVANGIKCLAGQDILLPFEPDFNFYHNIGDAIKKCDESS
jgi:hypothetical protein